MADAERKLAVAAVLARIDIATINGHNEEPRSYIGASSIGDPCLAYHALSLRGFPNTPPTARQIRTFRDGHRIEALVVEHLKAAGYRVEEIDPETGRQWAHWTLGGHVRAHLDGKIWMADGDEPMTLEVKSMGDKYFTAFVAKGVKVSHPKYYDQAQLGMKLSGMKRCFFIAYNKNTSEMHVEIIDYDAERARDLHVRAAAAAYAKPPKRISAHAEAYSCKGCFKRGACWAGRTPEVLECKHCVHAEAMDTSEFNPGLKKWHCTLFDVEAKQTCEQFRLFKVAPAR